MQIRLNGKAIIYRISVGVYVKAGEKKTYKYVDYATGLSVELKNWDAKKKQTRNDSYKNGQIADGEARIKEIISKLNREQNYTPESLRAELDADEKLNVLFNKNKEIILKEGESEYIPPFEFIQNYIDKSTVTTGTKKDYANTLNHLKDFDTYRGKSISWKSTGYEYYLDLVKYLKTQKNLKPSTIDKVIKNLKVFLQQADLTDNLEVNQDFKKVISGKSLFGKVNKDETEHVYLTEAEIAKITKAEMSDTRLSEIRDLFIIGCWTGLRISDLSRLERGNIKDGLLSITTKKTRQNIVIPVTDELQAVLDKYPDQLPKIPTDQHFNREVKKVCEQAEINDEVMAEVKKGKLTATAPVPKHKLITSHTARRSFATNLYRRGIPSTQLMFLTGHKTEDAFLQYIKVSKEDNAKDVAKKLKKIG